MNQRIESDWDYMPPVVAVERYPEFFPAGKGSWDWQLSQQRKAWEKAGVILNVGTGKVRPRWLFSPTRYMRYKLAEVNVA